MYFIIYVHVEFAKTSIISFLTIIVCGLLAESSGEKALWSFYRKLNLSDTKANIFYITW